MHPSTPRPRTTRPPRPLLAFAAVLAAAALLVSGLAAPARPAAARADGAGKARAGMAGPGMVGEHPTVFGHRGAAGYRPEHTSGSYELAVQMGADYIEPDLVPTKDGELVARHENEIGGTTDVARRAEFADRRTTKTIDGRKVTGWFTEDFTLAELKTLRAVERLPEARQHNTLYDGRYPLMTLQEIIDLAERLGREHKRTVGVFPETKHPTYFRSIGLPLEEPLIRTVKRNGLDRPDGRLVVQSFEPTSLRRLTRELRVTALQAISTSGAPYDTVAAGHGPTFADMTTPAGLREIRTYADWIGPDKRLVIPLREDGSLGAPTTLARDAHAAGLRISAYTFRNENQFLPAGLRTGTDPNAYGRAFEEYAAYFRAGLDAVVSDNPDTAVIAREALRERTAS
ncbi:glycerophosphodiester phosphodiesterase [Actinomadura viridis]|uniref:glycerophosphodiester phosphodiesterase n=1 Tax=Actinomadura viridis TaxID=58110 RepID=A0A931DME5_9ACTN|nr:glycerophosphodiester phosphodiesterase [Actinomadura viridis]MBG6090657.1 glycerophosphoryl diester phosphodiesterase [Actinomadura viridis]